MLYESSSDDFLHASYMRLLKANKLKIKSSQSLCLCQSDFKVNDMEFDTLMKIPFKWNSRIEILLNTQDYNCYNFDISSVAPQNFMIFLHQKAEILKILVIALFHDFLRVYSD